MKNALDHDIKVPNHIVSFMDTFRKAGFEIYLVGGSVRDLILNRPIDNWDFTTNANPDEIQGLFEKTIYNNDYGTVIIPVELKDDIKILCEVTPYRKEGKYSDGRHPDSIEWADNIEDDVERRDFTINALAYDGETLVDIVGGLDDMKAKVIKAVGDPDRRFKEDGLRLMRGIRFASQLEFMIEDETRDSIGRNAGLIKNISWERIRDEFLKILASDHPAEGIIFLKQLNILQEILPEVDACFAIEQKSPERHHIYDVGTHLIETVRHIPSKDPITRFAGLLHDVGKKDTLDVDPETGIKTFYNHEIVGANIANEVGERFRLSKKDRYKLVKLVRYHMFSVSEKQTDKAVRRFIRKVGKEDLQDMLDLRTGDRIGSGAKPTSWRTELFKDRLIEVQKKPFTVHDLKISGDDVMKKLNIKPGPIIGEILENLFEEVVESGLKNEKQVLLDRLETLRS